jgi:formamidopyrimidine-DNA glycosylase
MPELPEVETIIRRLRNGTKTHPPVPGHVIQSVQITWDRIIAEPDPPSFRENLMGKEIIGAQRRGKFLYFPLSKGHLIAHLRMSGDMRMEPRVTSENKPLPPDNYDRVILNFESPYRLAFNNIRKFGRMWYVENSQSIFGDLGPEPLSDSFTPDQFYEMLQSHSRQIKPLLMDQHFLAGLGNVYTDESLFWAKIHPLRQSDSLSKEEVKRLHDSIQSVLRLGIRRFGASIDWIYRGGEFQNSFKVYQQEGEPCPVCETPIEKIKVGQRGTHFCPNCQKPPKSKG